MNLTCEKCGTQQPLSDDDVILFHPRFFCLGCGDRIEMKIDDVLLEKLRGNNNRDRTLDSSKPSPPKETVRQVREESEATQGADGA